MIELAKKLLDVFTAGGSSLGGAVANMAKAAALVAAIAPAAIWLTGNKDAVFITISYGELAFWSGIVGVLVFVIVQLAHRSSPP